MKRLTTKELLVESFMELTTAKAINKITIANITDNCGMAQTTFYRHFKDKYDLISWIYVTDAQRIMCQIGTNGHMWRDTLTDAARDDYTTFDILKAYYQDEEEDMYWGQAQLEMIECIGEQNWLLRQL